MWVFSIFFLIFLVCFLISNVYVFVRKIILGKSTSQKSYALIGVFLVLSMLFWAISFFSPNKTTQKRNEPSLENKAEKPVTFDNFQSITYGMSSDEVLKIIGEPKEKVKSGALIDWRYEFYTKDEVLYASPIISFNDENKVTYINLNESYKKNQQRESKSAPVGKTPYSTTTSVSSKESSDSTKDENQDKLDNGDITYVVDKPSVEQKAILQELAESYFKEQYPYKGSKIHSVLGVITNWTKDKEHWFYKSEATIVNEFGAKKSTVIEIYIEPTSVDSGVVSILEY